MAVKTCYCNLITDVDWRGGSVTALFLKMVVVSGIEDVVIQSLRAIVACNTNPPG